MVNKKLLPAALLAALAMAQPHAQKKNTPQKIEWVGDENALKYEVELRSDSDALFEPIETETTEPYLALSLPVGSYRYRVTVYDFLGRKADVSSWTSFVVERRVKPEIVAANDSVAAADGSVEIPIEVSDVEDNSVVEMINPATNETIRGNLVIRGVRAQFDELPPGEWKIRVTNPGGESVEAPESIRVSSKAEDDAKKKAEEEERLRKERAEKEKEEEIARLKDMVEKERAENERLQKELLAAADSAKTEKERLSLERERLRNERFDKEKADRDERERLERERKENEKAEKAELKRQEKERLEREKAEKEERKRLEKEAKRKYKEEHPYKPKEITVLAGLGFAAASYDGTVSETAGNGALSFDARVSYIPIKAGNFRFGAEAGAWRSAFEKEERFLTARLAFTGIDAKALAQMNVFKNWYVSAKAGFGLLMTGKEIEYTSHDEGVGQPASETFLDASFCAGVSLFWIPMTHLAVEVGLDFTHAAISSMPTGFILPYIRLGLRI